ncbi:MAG: bifunctional UDP-N-acetylglucosamine diphosphorylase/glucosamine-1-phosphate N-acetyltransferase GlmU [Anaerolineae bacterium]|nr:bifunctional UDP-N-acetylglucosamine diphosphorylase/glucosamine-1-phosphate N-acetyltransferase GlmU [Anaerolineae bacterium]
MRIIPVVLAAGQGTRMHSTQPKVLHQILGKPMIWHALQAVDQVTKERPVVVVGYESDRVRQAVEHDVQFVVQEQRLGTGHAVQQTESLLRGSSDLVIVTYADMPLVSFATLQKLINTHLSHEGPLSLLTLVADDPRGFGRIQRSDDGSVLAIVEEAHATDEQKSICELNTGVMCFDADWLWDALSQIKLSPKGEYYLTDLVGIAVFEGKNVSAIQVDNPDEMIGVNTRVHLSEAALQMQQRINQSWMLAGVTLEDAKTVYIEPTVTLGEDSIIKPNTHLHGNTNIGAACVVGPNTIIHDSQLGNRCQVFSSVVEEAILEDDVDIGPFAHLRKGAHLAEGVHMGNFGEVKNSYLGPGSKMGHYSYLGDAILGPNVNIGAGTITCNYDGAQKHTTKIGAGVFVGSDTMLVAPLELGAGSRTGAGSVVTKNVPEDTLVVGMPARAIRKISKE